MLDGRVTMLAKHAAARRTLAIFLTLNLMAAGLAAWHEVRAADAGSVQALDVGDSDGVTASLAFALWGFADSQVQGYIYWLLPQFFKGGPRQAHAVSLYKMMQSLGWMVGFLLVPTDRVAPLVQLTLTALCCVSSVALALSTRSLP